MLIIKNGNDIEPLQHYKNVTVRERISDEHSFSFSLLATDEHYNLVNEENIVEYEGQEYRIKKLNERSKGLKAINQVKAYHVFFDLIDKRKYEVIGGNYTLDALLTFALDDTNFTFSVEGITGEKLVFNYGNANVLTLVKQAIEIFDAEFELNNRHITVKPQIGRITDNQFRYKHNLKAISKSIDTTKLVTIIKGYGQGFEVTYRSPMADIYGERHAEPIRNDEITDQAVMLDLLQRSLNDQPNISITVELSQLDFDVQKGDEIILIYEPLQIEMTARITEIEHYKEQPKASKITIANYKETVTDVMTMFQKDIKEVEKKNEINRSKIRQTDERITLEVERIDEGISENTSLIEQTADEINLTVSSLDTRLGSAESQISIQAGQISSKVSQTSYNGTTIASLINQTADTILISANAINLDGITTVNSDLNIGDSMSGSKYLRFRGKTGSTHIMSPSYAPDVLIIAGLNGINLLSEAGQIMANGNRILTTADTVTAVWG